MQTNSPTFYLASTEGYEMDEPRRCYPIKPMTVENSGPGWLVRIEPPLIGQKYGMGGQDLREVIVVPRYRGSSLLPVSEWPLAVYVVRAINVDDYRKDALNEGEYQIVAWAELYSTEPAANATTESLD